MFVVGCIDNELRLFPKNFTDNGLGNYKVQQLTGGLTGLKIFPSGTEQKGIMISDVACYTKLVEAFKLIKTPVLISTIEKPSESVPISGFVLNV
jgi:hypothetical protein